MFARPKHRHIRLSHLPKDIFFCLCLLLDMKSILTFASTSKHLKKKISLLLDNKDFCKKLAEQQFNPDQLASILNKDSFDYKQLLMTHSSPNKLLTSHFDTCNFYKYNLIVDLLTHRKTYDNTFINFTIDIDTIKTYLVNDAARKLLHATSRIGDIAPFINRDNFDKAHISKILTHIEKDTSATKIGDISFIHLIPLIIQFRAIKSFDVFIQSYLAMIIASPNIECVSSYALSDIYQYSLDSNDDYFIQRFLLLTLDIYPTNKAELYSLIKQTMDYGKSALVINAIESLPTERKAELFTAWRKMFVYDTLIHALYPIERSRHQLYDALKTAIKILEENNTLDINQIIEMQDNTHTRFDALINAHTNNQAQSLSKNL